MYVEWARIYGISIWKLFIDFRKHLLRSCWNRDVISLSSASHKIAQPRSAWASCWFRFNRPLPPARTVRAAQVLPLVSHVGRFFRRTVATQVEHAHALPAHKQTNTCTWSCVNKREVGWSVVGFDALLQNYVGVHVINDATQCCQTSSLTADVRRSATRTTTQLRHALRYEATCTLRYSTRACTTLT